MGWTYNTPDNVANDGPQVATVAIVFTTVSLILLLLRLYVRGYMIKAIGNDDWTLVLTWFASCGFATVTVMQTKWGLGLKELDDMPVENIYNFGLIQFVGAPFYITSILGFKLSLLLSYLRIMPKGAARNATIVIIIACVMFHVCFLLVQVNLCQPIAKQWNPSITWGKYVPAVPFYTSMASITIFFDVAVMFLPFPVLLRSQIQRRKKAALLCLFALGIFITIIQILRIRTVKSLSNYLDSAPLIMWSAVENNLGIIVASIPTLAPLFRYFAEKSAVGSTRTNPSAQQSQTVYSLKPRRGTGRDLKPNNVSVLRGGSEECILVDVAAINESRS